MAATKPNNIIDAYGVSALTSRHPLVRALKREGNQPSLHGNKVWRSSYALMDYFLQHPLPRAANVLDIGCGWGLTGIYIAREFGCQVTGMDADAAVAPFLRAQASLNNVTVDFRKRTFDQVRGADFRGVHTVIGADICFWDEFTSSIYNMINRALKAGVEQVLIADPGRQPFFDLAARCEADFLCEQFTHSVTRPAPSTKQMLRVRPG